MPGGVQRTPPQSGGGETGGGKAEFSRCNNQERQWLAANMTRAQLLGMQAQALEYGVATARQVRDLASNIEKTRNEQAGEWAEMVEIMRQKGRTEAVTQATKKWTEIDAITMKAAAMVESMGQKVGEPDSPAARRKDVEETAAQEQTISLQDLQQQLQAQLDQVRGEFEDRERRLRRDYEDRIQEAGERHKEEERERTVRYTDELKKMNNEMRRRDEEAKKREEDQAEEIKKLQQQVQGMTTQTGGTAASDDYAWDYYPYQQTESARDRLHREPSPVHNRRLMNILQGLGKQTQRSGTGDTSGNKGTTDTTRGQKTQGEQNTIAKRSKGSGVLARFGAFAGQVHMPATDPFSATMEDEGPDYYRTSFPPPFDEPPPGDAPRITEFRKLEGLVPKFSGNEDEFHGWVALFVPIIHRAKCPVAWKATILNKGMDVDKSATLKNIVTSGGATKEDYASTIHKLVRAFAHPQGLVAAKLRALESVVYVREGDHDTAEEWLIKLESYLTAARARGMQADIFSVQLYEDNLARMDDDLARSYLMWASIKDLPNNAVTICAWLEEKVDHVKQLRRRRIITESRANVANRYRARSSPPGKRSPRGATRTQYNKGWQDNDRRDKRSTCPMDGEPHTLERCTQFKALTPNERRQKLRDWKRCYACFSTGHNIGACTKGIRCEHCPNYHHTLLHGSSTNRRGTRRATDSRTMLTTAGTGGGDDTDGDSWSESSEPEEPSGHAYKATGTKHNKVVLQTVPIEVSNGNRKVKLNCLIDQGSTGAFMSRRAAEELQVTGYPTTAKITGFDGMVSQGRVVIANVQVAAWGAKKKHWVQVQVTKDPAGSYTPHDWTLSQKEYKHIQNLPILPPVPNRNVDIMLGMDTPHLIRSLVPDVAGQNDEPVARFTKLGWIVGGPVPGLGDRECRANFAFKAAGWREMEGPETQDWTSYVFRAASPDARELPATGRSADEDLKQLVVRMWEIDTATKNLKNTVQDEKIFKYLRHNLIQTEDKKYMLPTLWKKGHPNITNNFKYAEARLKSVVGSKHLKDPRIQAEYNDQIREWRAKGYTEKVHTQTPGADRAYYLPHFPVVRWDKSTTKVRIVMDGAAKPSKTGSQLCLNDCLIKGPKLVNELSTVLLRYRARKVALAADIKKMFFQIKLREQDRDFHRFLWYEEGRLQVYRWAVHPFGSAASPCIAIFAIKDHSRRWREKYPKAAETVIHSTLVDDNLDSCHTPKEAIELGQQLVGLFSEAGMELGKIISNDKQVSEAFPPEMRAKSLDIAEFCTEDLDTPVVKTLGMVYLSDEDAFSYEANIPQTQKWTKRTILRHKAKLYDPHGLLAPHTIVAGLVVQRLWRRGKNWDDEADAEELKQWEAWLKASRELPTLRIPRCLSRHPQEEASLHFFCDASADAYAAVAYYVTMSESNIVASKARVTPLKAVSIPRLELLAAELVLELVKLTREALQVPRSEYWYWSDSTNVLSWLNTESRTLQEFVANRVAKITDETDVTHWRWVQTDQNPADIPSRGTTADKLRDRELWWRGPSFIRTKEWPQQPNGQQMPEEAEKELKKGLAFNVRQDKISEDVYTPETDRWSYLKTSNWSRTVRAVARARRWRKASAPEAYPLIKEEIEAAEHILIRSMQETSFAKSRETIVAQQRLPRNSPLERLDPFLDHQGILRVGGRINQAKFVPFEQRHQMIIPKDHPWTEAIIRGAHRRLHHQGASHVTIELRQRYWIVRANQKVRSVVAACKWCTRQRAKMKPQKMAPIVPDRFPETRCNPFTYTALDAAGPYYIKTDTPGKAYFILFTCCTVRAVHLEAVFDLSTNAFLAALDRFVARRGRPEQIRSDNGTNFTAAYSELSKLWTKEARDVYLQERPHIKWIFNPPNAPYFGGLHERMVGAAKRALYHVTKANSAPTREDFTTLLAMVEATLNSRPLTCVSPDVDAPEVLTPSHFLGVQPYRPLATPADGPWDKRTLWRALQHRMDWLWGRFCLEMRSSLQEAQKWHGERRPLRAGDVVVVLESKERGRWPLGKVIRPEESRDGLVRKVHVLMRGNVVRRAVNGLILLVPGSVPTEATEKEARSKTLETDREALRSQREANRH